ncbi:MAG TPA: AbrB/MazE/SpoVT family DNA-binding domain-containing protein [Thermomicrobiales bacterium]|nr:AbrB/MazE/SpoVT family DNA-binding domain-containing protein [Thermomicrobiales bacterium]
MLHKVGAKGQLVIPKEIRERLGIEPGSLAVQHVVDDHLEVHFVTAEHHRSLKGSLAPYTNVCIPGDEALEEAIERAWDMAVEEEVARWRGQAT